MTFSQLRQAKGSNQNLVFFIYIRDFFAHFHSHIWHTFEIVHPNINISRYKRYIKPPNDGRTTRDFYHPFLQNENAYILSKYERIWINIDWEKCIFVIFSIMHQLDLEIFSKTISISVIILNKSCSGTLKKTPTFKLHSLTNWSMFFPIIKY